MHPNRSWGGTEAGEEAGDRQPLPAVHQRTATCHWPQHRQKPALTSLQLAGTLFRRAAAGAPALRESLPAAVHGSGEGEKEAPPWAAHPMQAQLALACNCAWERAKLGASLRLVRARAAHLACGRQRQLDVGIDVKVRRALVACSSTYVSKAFSAW